MNLFNMINHDWKTRLSRPATLLGLASFAIVLIYGSISGRLQRDRQFKAIENHKSQLAEAQKRWFADLTALENEDLTSKIPPWKGSPMDVPFSSYLRPGPLADFAIGQTDLLPSIGSISLWNPDIRLFSKYEFEDPVSLALGGFDLSKAIILIMPLLLIVFCFDILSGDRDARRLGLILAQGARLRTLFWQRLLIRAGFVAGPILVVVFFALLAHGGGIHLKERLPFFGYWSLTGILYGIFWIGLIAFVASRNQESTANLLWLLLAWVGVTLILPASLVAFAEALIPTPSRLVYLAEARQLENQTERLEATRANRFLLDHPELLAESTIPTYFRTAFLVTSAVDQATKPTLEAFEKATLDRKEALHFFRFFSPSIMVHSLYSDICGTSSARHHHYMSQARAFKAAFAEQVRPYVLAGKRLPLEEATFLPEFPIEAQSTAGLIRCHFGSFLYLVLLAAVLIYMADLRIVHLKGPADSA